MDGNTTTVGSIVGKLKIDSSDWNRELAAAETKAHQLGRANPTIKVDTAGAPQAVAALGAVEAAEKKVSASSSALARMREQGRIVTIAQAVTERDSVKPKMDFTQWTQRSTEATRHDTTAKNENAEANKRVDNTAKSAGGTIHALYASAALLAPAVAPLAGFAVAGAVAMGGLGMAGILAITGIKREIETSGPLADNFSEGISTLKGQFEGLGRTSAVGMLQGYNRAIATIDSHMPGLTQQTEQYSRALGNMGANTLSGLLGAFRTLDPVARAFTGYLGDMTERFSTLGSSNGLQRFGDYALATMPQVMATLEALVRGAGNLLTALAPLGGLGLAVLQAVGDGLAAIPTEVLTMLMSGALGAYAAFSAWSSLIPLIQSFGVMLNMSLGPIGLIVAGVGALVGVMIGAAAATKDNTAATMGYTAALERDSGAIAENVRAHAAHEIAQSGAAEKAEKLGINLGLLTEAAMGNADAHAQVTAELDRLDSKAKSADGTLLEMGGINHDLMKSNQAVQASVAEVRGELGNQSSALQGAVDNQKRFDEAMGSTTASAGNQSTELSVLAGMYGTSVSNILGARDAEAETATQLERTTLQMQLQNDAGELLKMQLDLISGKTLSFEQTQNAFEKQLISSTTALTNAKAAVDAHGNSLAANAVVLDGNSEAAVNNRGQLLGLVGSAQSSAEAFGQMTGKSEDARNKLIELRQKIIDNAAANGMNKDAVIAYVDSVMKIPNVKPTKIELDAAKAIADAAYLKQLIDQTNSKTVYLHAETSVGGPDPGQAQPGKGKNGLFAEGGMVNYLASGGFPQFKPVGTDTIPAMLTPGEIVIKKSSVDSIGADRLLAANKTGKLGGGVNIGTQNFYQQSDPVATSMDMTRRLRLLDA